MWDGFARRCFLGKQFLDVDRNVHDLPKDSRSGRLRVLGLPLAVCLGLPLAEKSPRSRNLFDSFS